MSNVPDAQSAFEANYRLIFEATNIGLVVYDINLERVVEANHAMCQMHGYTRQEFTGLDPRVFMLHESHALLRESIRATYLGGTGKSHFVHLYRDGSPFNVALQPALITYGGQPCVLCTVRDASDSSLTEKTLRGEVQARLREQATLLSISHTLASTLEFQPALILSQLREIVEYTRGGLFLLEDSTLVAAAMRGTPQLEHARPFEISLKNPKALVSLSNGHQPLCIANVWGDSPPAKFLRSLLDNKLNVLLEGMQSWMWVPLAVQDHILGGIGVAHTKPNHFTRHDASLALSVANQAAITKYNAELNRQAQAVAVLEERQRLAQNLHDAINQSLFSANIIADILPRLWERNPAEARQSLEDLRTLTRGAMAEMRALLVELRPSSELNADLGDLLRLLGQAFTGRTNIPADVSISGAGSLPAEVRLAIYHLCQEALNKIAKRAGADSVEIGLAYQNQGIELHIRECFPDLEPEQAFSAQHGLGKIRERAQAVGAILSSTYHPGQGAQLAISWHQTLHKEIP